MSYQKMEYRILPKTSFKVIRRCGGCGCKQNFVNTEKFRVNANGNALDVWLIYQCEKCKHTYNLTIFERVNPQMLESAEYQKFLENDKELAFVYGTKKELFAKNQAEINTEAMEYELLELSMGQQEQMEDCQKIIIHNEAGLQLRKDKVVAEILGISRSDAKKRLKEEKQIILEILTR